MQIVELGDYSMVIMKDSDDPPWESVGSIYRLAISFCHKILVDRDQITLNHITSTDFVYTAGRLVLFFKDIVPERFHLHDKVVLVSL